MKEVYIVFQEGERVDSSYYDILEVFATEEDARACIKTNADDFINACNKGEDESFKDYEVESDENSISVYDKERPEYYECYYYLKYDVK